MILKSETLAYIAGLVDGEGCVTLYGTGDKRAVHRMACFAPKLVIEMTDHDLIVWLREQTGVGSIHRHVPKNLRAKIRYRWQVKGQQAVTLLRHLIPWLRLKKQHAELLFAFASTVTKRCKSGLTQKVITRREVLVAGIRQLNHRGRPTGDMP
jgi:hypothetical protein